MQSPPEVVVIRGLVHKAPAMSVNDQTAGLPTVKEEHPVKRRPIDRLAGYRESRTPPRLAHVAERGARGNTHPQSIASIGRNAPGVRLHRCAKEAADEFWVGFKPPRRHHYLARKMEFRWPRHQRSVRRHQSGLRPWSRSAHAPRDHGAPHSIRRSVHARAIPRRSPCAGRFPLRLAELPTQGSQLEARRRDQDAPHSARRASGLDNPHRDRTAFFLPTISLRVVVGPPLLQLKRDGRLLRNRLYTPLAVRTYHSAWTGSTSPSSRART